MRHLLEHFRFNLEFHSGFFLGEKGGGGGDSSFGFL